MASQPQNKDDEVIGKCLDCKLSHEETGEKNTVYGALSSFFQNPLTSKI